MESHLVANAVRCSVRSAQEGIIRSGTGQSVRSQLLLSRVGPNGLWSKRRVRNIVPMVR